MKFKGVCCTCHSIHPVRRMVGAPRPCGDGLDDDGNVFIEDNQYDYVMEEHFPFGNKNKPCSGSGDSPQTLVKVKP
jgi:hypothetical protein